LVYGQHGYYGTAQVKVLCPFWGKLEKDLQLVKHSVISSFEDEKKEEDTGKSELVEDEKKEEDTDKSESVYPKNSVKTMKKLPHVVYKKSLDKSEKVIERKRNRWGDGLAHPSQGTLVFFPDSWVPTQDVGESLKLFGLSSKDVERVVDRGNRLSEEMKMMYVALSPAFASAIYAYTIEDDNNVYGKLNLACRKTGRAAERRRKPYLNYLYYLNKGTGIMPTFIGRTYRGVKQRFPPNYYPVGGKITWHQLSSSSKSALVTLNFLERNSNGELMGSLFILDVDSGHEIELLSQIPDEEEVLLQVNSFFCVEKKITGERRCEELPDLAAYNLENVDIYVMKQL